MVTDVGVKCTEPRDNSVAGGIMFLVGATSIMASHVYEYDV